MYYVDGIHEKNIFSGELPFRLEINIEKNFKYPLHWHSAIEIIFVEQNDFSVLVNNEEYFLREKEIMVIAPGDTHEFACTGTGIRYFIQFDIASFDVAGRNYFREHFSDILIFTQGQEISTKLTQHIKDIVACYKDRKNGSELYLSARIFDILYLLTYYVRSQETVKIKAKKLSGLDKINEAFEYIHKKYTEDIQLEDVAKLVGLSEYYFSRLFKQITEKSFYNYLNEYRIKQSEMLITNSSMSITEIAYAVGFNSIVTFNRCFKTVKGCSPTTYKKIRKGAE